MRDNNIENTNMNHTPEQSVQENKPETPEEVRQTSEPREIPIYSSETTEAPNKALNEDTTVSTEETKVAEEPVYEPAPFVGAIDYTQRTDSQKTQQSPQKPVTPPYSGYSQSPNHTYPPYAPYLPYDKQGGETPPPSTPQGGQRQGKHPKKKRTWPRIIALFLAVILVSGATSFIVANYVVGKKDYSVPAPSVSDQGDGEIALPPETSEGLQNTEVTAPHSNITGIANKVAPTVVEVSTESKTTHPFFGDFIAGGAGSGVIVTEDGYIVTNNHVIEDATSIQIRTSDGEIYPAELVGRDAETDLAVLKVDATGLPTATFADSDYLEVGDLVIAVGNPLGTLGGTVTDGIISALNREIEIEGQKMTLIQTSAAVNQGNSGGGLFDANGDLVGIVNAKSSGSGIEGLGFAIPANLAKDVVAQIMDVGYVTGRPQLGIVVVEIFDLAAANHYGVKEYGVYINDVTRDNGLMIGDRFLSIDGQEIESFEDIKAILEAKKAKDVLEVVVERDGERVELAVELGEKLPDHIEEPKSTPASTQR